MAASGKLRVLFKSSVKSIGEDDVDIEHDGTTETLPNTAFVVSAGDILRTIGIHVETTWGTE
jgi:hypothetical protein